MRYATKVAIIPYDRYNNLCGTEQDTFRSQDIVSSENSSQFSNQKEVNGKAQSSSESGDWISPNVEKTEEPVNEKESVAQFLSTGRDVIVLKYKDIITSIPKYLQNRALALLDFIVNKTSIKWAENGNIIVNGEVIENSHIVDIVRDAISPYGEKKKPPVGLAQFYRELGNIPLSLIHNQNRHRLVSAIAVGAGTSLLNSLSPPPPGIPDKQEKPLETVIKDQKWKKLWIKRK